MIDDTSIFDNYAQKQIDKCKELINSGDPKFKLDDNFIANHLEDCIKLWCHRRLITETCDYMKENQKDIEKEHSIQLNVKQYEDIMDGFDVAIKINGFPTYILKLKTHEDFLINLKKEQKSSSVALLKGASNEI